MNADFNKILRELYAKRDRQAANLKATEEHIAAIKGLQELGEPLVKNAAQKPAR